MHKSSSSSSRQLKPKPRRKNRFSDLPRLGPYIDVQKPSPCLRFNKKTGGFLGLNRKAAIELLAAPEPSFWRHKEIVFEGFKAWVLASEDLRASKHAIIIATANAIVGAEKSKAYRDMVPDAKYVIQQHRRYKPIFSRIYHRIGGTAALVAAIRANKKSGGNGKTGKHKAHPTTATTDVLRMVAIATVWDYHVRHLYDDVGKKYGYPNIEDAAPVVGSLLVIWEKLGSLEIRKKGVSQSHIRNSVWPAHRNAIAFLYAADRVVTDEGLTLLELLIAGRLTYRRAKPYIGKWLGYASYFEKVVMSKLKATTVQSQLLLVNVTPDQPELRHLENDVIEKIKTTFSNQKPSQRRLK